MDLRYATAFTDTQTSAKTTPPPAMLWPKEHGAYAEVLFPLATALALGRPTLVAVLLVTASIGAFLLHEPVLVMVGARGRRRQETHGLVAGRQFRVVGAATSLAALAAMALADDATRWALLPPAVLAHVVVPVVLLRREKTAPGETLVAATFSAMAVPVAMASGVGWLVATTAAVLWFCVFLLGTLMVRLTLERARKERGPMRIATPITAGVLLCGALAGVVELGLAPLAVVPIALASLWSWLRPVPAKKLRVVGWSLVGGSVFAFVTMLVTLG